MCYELWAIGYGLNLGLWLWLGLGLVRVRDRVMIKAGDRIRVRDSAKGANGVVSLGILVGSLDTQHSDNNPLPYHCRFQTHIYLL